MPGPIPFLPGAALERLEPLARFLPPLPAGIASTWLASQASPGAWVLDPFGASPPLAVEAARAGYRVLAAVNNPVLRSLLEWEATPPSEAELQAALADLASAYKGNERLEPHLKGLYRTECASCQAIVSAEAFIWEKGTPAPVARLYTCPECGDSGEKPATPKDAALAAQFGAGKLHRARALERVAPLSDPDRVYVEEALDIYLPRAVYALFTLINRLDGLSLSPARRSAAQALILHACDQACSLWGHPATRERPRQLSLPSRFRENNVWLAVEGGIPLWAARDTPVPLSRWPALPPESGGICVFDGRLKEFAEGLKKIQIAAVLGALPRPNQAFWTLSALWSGWLWGQEAAASFKSVLRRRRYDWGWHTAALTAALEPLAAFLPKRTLFLGLLGEAEPGFLSAALLAGAESGLSLDGLAMRNLQAQIYWSTPAGPPPPAPPRPLPAEARQVAIAAGSDFLQQTGQPLPYLPVLTTVLASLALQNLLLVKEKIAETTPAAEDTKPTEPTPSRDFAHLQGIFRETFNYRSGFLHLEGREGNLESGQWWLHQKGDSLPLPGSALDDRVEKALVGFLIRHPQAAFPTLEAHLCAEFPGLATPEPALVQACLESYGKSEAGLWQLKPEDQPANRRADLEAMRRHVAQLGEKFGFTVEPGSGQPTSPILWSWSTGKPEYAFYVIVSAVLSEIIAAARQLPASASQHAVILIPGSRATLALYKIKTNLLLRHLLEPKEEAYPDWHLVKFRHFRRLSESFLLTPAELEKQLDADPVI